MNMYEATIQLLKNVPYFMDLNPSVLAAIAERSRTKSLREGQFVFMEGDLCQDLYILRIRASEVLSDER